MDLYVCPVCGLITYKEGVCKYCNASLVKQEMTFDDVIKNKFYALDNLNKKYYKKDLYDKKSWKIREKLDKLRYKKYSSEIWDNSIRQPICICPKCGYITFKKSFYDEDACVYCGTKYAISKISAFDYFNPQLKGIGYMENQLQEQLQSLCVKSSEYDDELFTKQKEFTIQQYNISDAEDSFLTTGVITSLFTIPNSIKTGQNDLVAVMEYYLPSLNNSLKLLANDSSNNELQKKSLLIINQIFNIFRCNRFLGQESNIIFIMLILADIVEEIKNCK